MPHTNDVLGIGIALGSCCLDLVNDPHLVPLACIDVVRPSNLHRHCWPEDTGLVKLSPAVDLGMG
jgi:hypothetical protein